MRHLTLTLVVVIVVLFTKDANSSAAIILEVFDENVFVPKNGFREQGLRLHNHYRSLNKVSPLKLDHELNKLAHAHAEKLASWNNLTASETGFDENLWSHRGELLPLAKDLEYAIRCWYTGSTTPGRVQASVDHFVLRSDSVTSVGFGVGTSEHNGEGYSVVVALYQ